MEGSCDEQKPPENQFIYNETWKAMIYLNMKNQENKLTSNYVSDQKYVIFIYSAFSLFVTNINRNKCQETSEFHPWVCISEV